MSKAILTFVSLSVFTVVTAVADPLAVQSCEVRFSVDDARLWQCAGLKVLVVRGNPERRAEAHGRLLGPHLSSATLDVFADAPLLGLEDSPFLRFVAEKAFHLWTRVVDRAAPPSYHREVAAYARGAGIPLMRARRALVSPDTAVYAWSMLEKPFFRAASFGCTSGVWSDGKGRTVVGRNLDFGGVGAFDAHPLMVVNLPEEGSGDLRHLVFGADGLPFGGITGFNEAGLAFAIHQNYTRDAVTGGVPMPFIGELVLRRAKSIDEATQIIKDHRPGRLWTFVLTEMATGRVRAIEASLKHFSVRDGQNLFAQTNHSQAIETRADELIDLGTRLNSEYRYDLMIRSLRETKDPLSAVARALAYQQDPRGDLSIHHDVIKPLTIQTFLGERTNDGRLRVHLSFDPAPTASGRFAGFEVEDLWGALKAETLKVDVISPSGTEPEKRRRQEQSARAYAAYEKPDGADESLRRLDGQESVGALLARATLALASEKPAQASELVKMARTKDLADHPVHIQQAFSWVELAAFVRGNEFESARALSQKILREGKVIDPGLAYLATEVAAGRKVPQSETALGFDFFSGYIENRPLAPKAWSQISP